MKKLFAATWSMFALVIVGMLPFLIVGEIVDWTSLAKTVVYGFFVGLIATVLNGPRIGVWFAVIFAVFSVVGTASWMSPLAGALTVALSSALIPLFATVGRSQAMLTAAMFVPYSIQNTPSSWAAQSSETALALAGEGIAMFIACLWGLLIGYFIFKKLPTLPSAPNTPSADALVGGALLVVVTGVITYICIADYADTKWAWLLAAIYALTKPIPGYNLRMSIEMIIGTVVGLGCSFLVLLIPMATGLEILVGGLVLSCAIAMLILKKPYWLYICVTTPGVILLTGAGMDPYVAIEDRLITSALGAVVAVALGAGITWSVQLSRRIRVKDGLSA